MKCPKCRQEAKRVPFYDVTWPAEEVRLSHTLAGNLFKVATTTYRAVKTVQYQCTNTTCNHRWDEK